MVSRAEMHKKMIKTVTDKLPQYIMHYSPEDQILLDEFVKLLKEFEKAEVLRTDLINNYESYSKRLLETKIYLRTPFLWFTVAYFQKARLILSWSDFQAISFYEYLARILRKDPSYEGVFELVRKQVPLSDRKWEQLQYASMKMLKPLSKEEIQIIGELITIVKKQGIYALDSRKVRKRLSTLFTKGAKTNKVISAFLTNLESRWHLYLHSTAFGIERLFFHIQTQKIEMDEIISFQDPKNTILCLSDIFVSRDQSNDYIGIFYVPTQDINSLTIFLKNLEQKNVLKLKELSRITTSFRGLSLERYSPDKGWLLCSKTDFQKVVDLLGGDTEEQAITEGLLTNINHSVNQKWKFDQHQLPIELIRLYCEIKSNYYFSELPFPLDKEKGKKTNNKTTIGLLKQLTYNNILSIDWVPWRLVYEYSLDFYWIIIPNKYLKNISHFLKIVPVSMVYLSEEKFFLWLHLTPQMVNYLQKEFNWQIYPTAYYTTPLPATFNWFNQEELRWKTPDVINK